MSTINKLTSSLGKSKSLRNLAIATALFGVMSATQSCGDKNKGMPVRCENMDLSVKENTDKASEAIKIENNKVSLSYVTDGDIEWKQKEITYTLEVNKDVDGKIVVHLEGDTYFGNEIETNVKLNTDFTYASLEDFNAHFTDQCGDYLDNAMADLKNEENQFKGEDEQSTSDYDSEFSSKTEILTGWLKYYTNNKHKVQENPVQKEGDIISIPFARKGKKIQLTLQKPQTEIVVINKAGEKSYAYDLKINGETSKVYMLDDAIKAAEALFDKLPDSLKNNISEQDKYERFLPKCLEAVQLIQQ